MADDGDELDAIAAELYALPPAEFTAARNARAGLAAPALARRLKTLRKPTVSAWAVNLLARDGQLAEDAGGSLSAAARDDVATTINAAVMDAAAAAAVLTARLVKPLEAGDIDPAALADAVGGTLPGAVAAPPRDDLAERRARKAAEKAAREAERLASEAERALARIDARRAKAQERVDHVRERIDDLRRDLAALESDERVAGEKLDAIEREHSEAAAASRAAAEHAQRAQRALDES